MDIQLHDVVTAVVAFAAGFGTAAAVGRAKFAEVQTELREVKGRAARELGDLKAKLNRKGNPVNEG